MNAKRPAEIIEEAVNRLPVAHLFADEAAAERWVSSAAKALLAHKLEVMALSAEERERVDPIEAGYLHAKDMGTRPRRQRIAWIDSLVESVAQLCYCVVIPQSGTMSSWLIGRRSDRLAVMALLASLVPTAERLAQDAYLKEYHTQRKAGNVEAARGYKDTWLDEFVNKTVSAFQGQERELTAAKPEAAEVLASAQNDVIAYMNENFLPTRGNRNERRAGA